MLFPGVYPRWHRTDKTARRKTEETKTNPSKTHRTTNTHNPTTPSADRKGLKNAIFPFFLPTPQPTQGLRDPALAAPPRCPLGQGSGASRWHRPPDPFGEPPQVARGFPGPTGPWGDPTKTPQTRLTPEQRHGRPAPRPPSGSAAPPARIFTTPREEAPGWISAQAPLFADLIILL